jgi:hypothetical protein
VTFEQRAGPLDVGGRVAYVVVGEHDAFAARQRDARVDAVHLAVEILVTRVYGDVAADALPRAAVRVEDFRGRAVHHQHLAARLRE